MVKPEPTNTFYLPIIPEVQVPVASTRSDLETCFFFVHFKTVYATIQLFPITQGEICRFFKCSNTINTVVFVVWTLARGLLHHFTADVPSAQFVFCTNTHPTHPRAAAPSGCLLNNHFLIVQSFSDSCQVLKAINL